MSTGTSVSQIDAVDAFARSLYRQAKSAGADFADVATVVRRLHTVLKHLKVEAEDPDSLLTSSSSSVYARQLTPIIEDCDFTLKQLDTLLEKCGEATKLEERERDMVAMIRTKLSNQKTNIDMFLDTVQLHNPTKTQRVVDSSDTNLDGIKDKVDAIAARLFHRRDSGLGVDDQEDMWQQFSIELEKEGFSKDVLRQNKDVLRAYIRELESSGAMDNGAPPSVRGLLEQEKVNADPTLAIVPASYSQRDDMSPKEMHPAYDNDKFVPAMKFERPMPEQRPAGMSPNLPQAPTFDKFSSDDDADSIDSGSSMALISTRDLMSMDHLTAQVGGMHLQPASPQQHYSISPSTSPSARYLPPAAPQGPEFSTSPGSMGLAVSPRFVPPLPPYPAGSPAPGVGPPPPYASPRPARLAPDRYGMDIPPDAKWTRIRRSLVSPEVLERVGVRYEARPDFVAILGILSREEIAEFARLSHEARQLRSGRKPASPFTSAAQDKYTPRPAQSEKQHAQHPPHEKGSTSDDDSSDVLYDSDTTDGDDYGDEKGTKSYFIVPPPDKDKGTSPAATVQPKPILKNRNEHQVRFGPDPYEVDPDEAGRSPRRSRDSDRDRDRDRDVRDRDRDRRERRRHRDRDHDRDRDRDKDRDYRRRHRDRDRDHNRDRDRKDDKTNKKKAWGETLGAVGIGGAAASLLSVLTEAASALT